MTIITAASCTKSTIKQEPSNSFTKDTVLSYQVILAVPNFTNTLDYQLTAVVSDLNGTSKEYKEFAATNSENVLQLSQQIHILPSTLSVYIIVEDVVNCSRKVAYVRNEEVLYNNIVLN